MGKRTRTESSDYNNLAKRLKKLEKSLSRTRRKKNTSSSSSSSSSSESSSRSSSSPRQRSRSPAQRVSRERLCIEDLPIQYEPMPSTSAASMPPRAPSQAGTRPNSPAPPHQLPEQLAQGYNVCAEGAASPLHGPSSAPPELDGNLLELLGDDPSRIDVYGKPIQPELAVRLNHICTSGLTKESRKELLEKYLVPENSKLIGAPLLNPELKAAISETVLKKDKAIEFKQKQLSSATSCLAEALTLSLSAEIINAPLIKLLMDASKILCDSQNADSNTRKAFIQFNIKKEFKDHLKNTKIDEFLFGADVAETLKVAKAINKSGSDMRVPSVKQPKPTAQNAPQKNLNWRGPPQSYRPKGTQKRTKEPATNKNQRESSSRPSSRAAPKSSRYRR